MILWDAGWRKGEERVEVSLLNLEEDKKWCEVFGCGREASGSYAIAPGTRIRLCHECAALFESQNIRQSVAKACLELVKDAVRPKLLNILRMLASSPLGALAFGGVSTLFFTEIMMSFGLRRLDAVLTIVVIFLAVLLKLVRNFRTSTL